ncbi:N-formylglutamate amidohydrolase [Methylocystis bryophila]|uniref:N-formylglutamate amidohydrolase n=1 Tax=Methylocystis bryophila TaxID=655015 RepID=A0A1W6MR69_9HYPH|nr:N-formylglutamate amidohydrolase [Methylocystis bryophila]ARN80075.1 N-formylglutamate amidohydrolase [Methylocystis bryophila]BDV39994.1 N-formylglutamate amidohydrolase [Methylocystis bryophila]
MTGEFEPNRLQRALEAGRASPVEPELGEPLALLAARDATTPLVFSSPHSGRIYPARFLEATKLDIATLRRSEDAFVDELFQPAAALGAPMLCAKFPRAYLDLNREPYELDQRMFEDALPENANSRSLRVAAGLGTIPRVVADAREIYREKLRVADALLRIGGLYEPYHIALAELMNRARQEHGVAVLIDCHSMPTLMAREGARAEKRRVDFVIGDRFGASCEQRLADALEETLRRLGYNVHRNRPYAGGFITEHYGRPRTGRHAVQIEVARSLYMDEARLEPNDQFQTVAEHLREAIGELLRAVGDAAPPARLAAE